jgi:hypothetical protein
MAILGFYLRTEKTGETKYTEGSGEDTVSHEMLL